MRYGKSFNAAVPRNASCGGSSAYQEDYGLAAHTRAVVVSECAVIVDGGGLVVVVFRFFRWSWIPQFRRLIFRIDPLLLEHGVSPSSKHLALSLSTQQYSAAAAATVNELTAAGRQREFPSFFCRLLVEQCFTKGEFFRFTVNTTTTVLHCTDCRLKRKLHEIGVCRRKTTGTGL